VSQDPPSFDLPLPMTSGSAANADVKANAACENHKRKPGEQSHAYDQQKRNHAASAFIAYALFALRRWLVSAIKHLSQRWYVNQTRIGRLHRSHLGALESCAVSACPARFLRAIYALRLFALRIDLPHSNV